MSRYRLFRTSDLPLNRFRSIRGSTLVESVVAISLLVPLTLFVLFACLEVVYAYVIVTNMNEAAYLAARACAHTFQKYPMIVKDADKVNEIMRSIRRPMMVSGNEQFNVESWQLNGFPRTVTVSVSYLPGVGDPPLPPFPNPDLLHLRDKIQLFSRVTVCLD